jgi:hypothetical protein
MRAFPTRFDALFLAGAALFLANLACANDQSTAVSSNTYRAKEVLGSKVHIENDLSIGLVDDIVFGDDGVIDYLIVNNQNKLVTVPWEAAKFNFEKRTAVIQISQERFREIPTYTVEKYPTFSTPAYRTQIYKSYGLTPHERRALRRGVAP